MPELPAENTSLNYISTNMVIRAGVADQKLVIPKEITALEAACLTMFMHEYAGQLVSYRFNLAERLRHYGLERFLVEVD